MIRHGALVFMAAMFVNVLNFAFHFLVIRRLGVVDYGSLSSLVTSLAIFGVPASIVTLIVVRYVAEFRAVGDLGKVRTLSTRLMLGGAIIGLAVVGTTAIAGGAIAVYLQIPQKLAVTIAGITLALALIVPSVRGVLQGMEDFRRYALSTAVEAVAKVGLGIWFVHLGWGLTGAVGGYALGTFFGLVYTVCAVRVHFGPVADSLHLDFRRLFQTSGAIAATQLSLTVLGFVDVPLVKHFFQPHAAGIYSGAALVGRILLFVVGFVPTIVLPKATACAMRGESPRSILVQAFLLTIGVSALGLVIALLFPALVMRILGGADFRAAAGFIFQYGIAMTLLAATTIAATYKIGLHRFDYVPVLVAATLAEIIAINLFHHSLAQVIDILIACNGVAFLGTIMRITAPLSSAAAVAPEAA